MVPLLLVVVVLVCGAVGINPVSSDKIPPSNVEATVFMVPLAICMGAVEYELIVVEVEKRLLDCIKELLPEKVGTAIPALPPPPYEWSEEEEVVKSCAITDDVCIIGHSNNNMMYILFKSNSLMDITLLLSCTP